MAPQFGYRSIIVIAPLLHTTVAPAHCTAQPTLPLTTAPLHRTTESADTSVTAVSDGSFTVPDSRQSRQLLCTRQQTEPAAPLYQTADSVGSSSVPDSRQCRQLLCTTVDRSAAVVPCVPLCAGLSRRAGMPTLGLTGRRWTLPLVCTLLCWLTVGVLCGEQDSLCGWSCCEVGPNCSSALHVICHCPDQSLVSASGYRAPRLSSSNGDIG